MKIVFLSFVSLIVLSSFFTSCKKDYSCECSFSDSSKNFSIAIKKMYKNDAKVVCSDYSTAIGSCKIK